MDRPYFEAARFMAMRPIEVMELVARFNFAYKRTADISTAMAAVNEVLEAPISYEQFRERIRRS